MSHVVISTRGIGRRFGDLVAVEDVTLDVEKGAIFGLLGPNGSGKSTIIRMLLGILPPSSGAAHVLGHDVLSESEQIKHRVGYMSQSFSLYSDLTVRENIEFYGRIYGLRPKELDARAQHVLNLTSLEDRIEQSAGTLSGGWKQRLALACALVHDPDLLFLDEPTAGIDPVARRQLWDLLFDLSGRGVTLFVTTHYMDEAERCTRVGYIYLSRLLVEGRPEELKQLPDVTPDGARRMEMRVAAPSTVLSQLRRVTGVRDATIFGETIHVLLDASVTEDVLVEALQLDRGKVECREVAASLEDVFVALTTSAERDREPVVRLDSPSHDLPPVENTAAGNRLQGDRTEVSSARSEPIPDQSTERMASASGDLIGEGASRRETGATGASDVDVAVDPQEDRQRDGAHDARKASSNDGLMAVLFKEFVHVRRQPSTLVFVLLVPLLQTIIFGFALDTQIDNIPLVVFDQDGRRMGRELIDAFRNTRRFAIVERVYDEESFRRAMTSGRARAGLRVPSNYSDRSVRGEQVAVQLLIDGSDSQVATTALNTAQLLRIELSLRMARARGEATQSAVARDQHGRFAVPIEIRPRLLYNPDLKSSHFFVPGLVGIVLQLVTVFLTSFAVVRERELGTLEQLFVTPVGRSGLLLGKLIPYAILGFVETLIILLVMVYVFGVPIHGSIPLLLGLTLLFMVCSLGMGLLVSTIAKTQLEAVQFAFIIMLPSVLLSGFMFPRAEMPLPIYLVSFLIPVTYYIEILRGVVLRGADLVDLWTAVAGLGICGLVVLGLSLARFRKEIG